MGLRETASRGTHSTACHAWAHHALAGAASVRGSELRLEGDAALCGALKRLKRQPCMYLHTCLLVMLA